MTDVPEAVRLAVANRTETNTPSRPGTTPAFTESSRISRGDLRIVSPTAGDRPAESRLCLVVGVDPTDEFADVVLTHTAPELATSVDGVVPPELSGAPYDIVVQTDLRGAVWTLQLGRRVGWIDEPALKNLTSIVLGRTEDPDSSGVGLHAGIPLQGPTDRRWSFKEEEGAELRRLTANCTDAVLDGDSVWEIDSGLLVSDRLGEPDDQVAIVAELWEWTRTQEDSPRHHDRRCSRSAPRFLGYGVGTMVRCERSRHGSEHVDLGPRCRRFHERSVERTD